jgi:hypothetical protein
MAGIGQLVEELERSYEEAVERRSALEAATA